MTFKELITDLKNKIYRPVYMLHGEEPYYIDVISDYIEEHVLTDVEKEFNQSVLYGRDVDVATIVSNAKRYPMMANYQVVIVKEAQEVDKLEDLSAYIDSPVPSTILVICHKYKKIDKRKKFAKDVEKKGVLFESAKMYDNQIPAWINDYLREKNYKITQDGTTMLADFLGTDLTKIVNEINKLILNTPPNTNITPEIIEKNIGISKDFNVFELQKSLGKKDILKSNQIINYFAANPRENPLVKISPILYSYFAKILTYHHIADKSNNNNVASVLGVSPFFVKDYTDAARSYPEAKLHQIIALIREYDLKSKGVGSVSAADGELMKELIFRILH